jgi:hypothetical protein
VTRDWSLWERIRDLEEDVPSDEALLGLLQAVRTRLCVLLGHEWEVDMCGWLDHCYCVLCSAGIGEYLTLDQAQLAMGRPLPRAPLDKRVQFKEDAP